MIMLPAAFGLILAVLDSYRLAFFILGGIPIVVSVMLMHSALQQSHRI